MTEEDSFIILLRTHIKHQKRKRETDQPRFYSRGKKGKNNDNNNKKKTATDERDPFRNIQMIRRGCFARQDGISGILVYNK
jgi:hypothetical protein